jgi:hypothetical protein
MRAAAENNCQTYKFELVRLNHLTQNKTNKIYEESEKKYFPMLEKLKLNEENRISFVKFHFEKFSKLIEEHTTNTTDLYNRLHNSLVEIKIEDDLKLFDEKFNYLYKNHERIPKEEFMNYDIYRRNMDKLITSHFIQNENTAAESDLDASIITTQDDKKTFIDKFFKDMTNRDAEISMEDLSIVIDNICNNIEFSRLFIDRLLIIYKNVISVRVPNYQNFHHLSHILLNIANNTDIRSEYFGINFAIIFIAEKTYYLNPENKLNKIYLCSIIGRNKFISSKNFWTSLIDIKINTAIDKRLNSEARKMHTTSASMNTNIDKNKSGYLDSFGSRMKFLFQSNKDKNKDIRESIPSHTYTEIKINEAGTVLHNFITHFANFNFDVSTAIDIIVEYSTKYEFDKDKVSYYISILNSDMFTIKNKNSLEKDIDIHSIYFNRDFKKYMSLNDNVISIFAYAFRYLKNDDYANILCLNKTFNKKLTKILYKNILLKYHNMDNNMRLKLWSNLLKVVNI